MGPAARAVRQRVGDAVARWGSLATVFDTPDTGTVVAGLHPAEVAATDFDDATAAASIALRSLGENLRTLEWTRARLIDDIAAHRSTVLAFRASEPDAADPADPLTGWGPYGYSQNEELRERCESLRRSLRAALEECEQDLGRIGDVERASPVMWARVSRPGPSLTWAQQNTRFSSLVSMSILHRLATLDADEMGRMITEHPEWSTMLRDHPPAPKDVAAWWRNVDASHATALIAGASFIIGNLEGVTYRSRDLANRTTLTRQIDEARAALAAEEERHERNWGDARGGGDWRGRRGAELRDRLANLLNIEAALDSSQGRAPRHLVSLSDDFPPLAAVSIGDLDTARGVTYAVPGMGTTSRDMMAWTMSAQHLLDEQRHQSAEEELAVVAWIGYKTPPVPVVEGAFEVLANDYAEVGGSKLSSALIGFASVRTDRPTLNVLGHSYGTTTASVALTMPDTPRVSTFVSLGSAGLPAWIDVATDLKADGVYAGQARNVIPFVEGGQGDQWAWTGRTSFEHPVDPTSAAFGAHSFGADGDIRMHPVTDHSVSVTSAEGWGYLDPSTESLLNSALVTTNHADLLSAAIPKGPTPLQQAWTSLLQTPWFSL